MVKLQFIVGLFALVTGVQALDQAVPYELLYFYSIYKMEYRAVAEGSRLIATGCKLAFRSYDRHEADTRQAYTPSIYPPLDRNSRQMLLQRVSQAFAPSMSLSRRSAPSKHWVNCHGVLLGAPSTRTRTTRQRESSC